MNYRFAVWAKSEFHNGDRDTADTIVLFTCPEGWLPESMSAKAVAKALDKGRVPNGLTRHGSAKLATGHGVTVTYPSGKVQTFKA